jgi:DNA-directed RNA polymerase specialized sigma24 family protein
MEHAEKLLIDPAVAAGLLEEAAATVSRTIEAKRRVPQNEVRDLPSYLFYAFLRRLNRARRRQLTQEDAVRALALASDSSTNPQAYLDLKILVDELLTRCDPVTRDMFYRRIKGFSWKEIAVPYRISAHAARSRFSQALRRIGGMLGLRSDL